jgi:hypothetical protein
MRAGDFESPLRLIALATTTGRDAEIEGVCEDRAQYPHPTWDARRYAARGGTLDVGSGSGAWGHDEGRALSLTALTLFTFDIILRNVD